MNDQVKKEITELIDGSRDAIVCSINEEGYPNAKAMFRQVNDGVKTFLFSTNTSSIRTHQFLEREKSCIYFFDPEKISGIMLTGTMKVCTDDATRLSIWHPDDVQYYPLGPADPDYSVLRFTAEKGNYYHFGDKCLFDVKEF